MAIVGSQLISKFGPSGQVAALAANSVFVDSRGGSSGGSSESGGSSANEDLIEPGDDNFELI
jgi:hypothetical protein